MKNSVVLFLVLFSFSTTFAQSITGKWKTIDDDTGEQKSVVEIYETNGKIYGKIIKLFNPSSKNPICKKCKDDKMNKPIIGMVIIDGLTKDEDAYDDGTILNPSNGKVYSCRLKLEEDHPNRLQVRGYVSFFYKTQYWQRIID
jgi:uncharacterized protein (DUF2147 family)